MEEKMDKKYGECNHTVLRPRNPRDYSKYLGVQKPRYYMILNVLLETLEHTDLAQYSIKKGLQVFGQCSTDAVNTNMQQLH